MAGAAHRDRPAAAVLEDEIGLQLVAPGDGEGYFTGRSDGLRPSTGEDFVVATT